jgi:HlyD family secretion protein
MRFSCKPVAAMQSPNGSGKKPVLIAVGVAVCAVAIGLGWHLKGGQAVEFKTATVRRGDLSSTISASGTIEPLEVIDVGAQVAGLIRSFGKDKSGKPVDYGSLVEKGGILAVIDDSVYNADLALANAQVEQDKAGELSAAANLQQIKARLVQTEAEWNRAQELNRAKLISGTDYDTYKANYEVAKANVSVGESAVAQMRAASVQAQALLDKAKRNLGFCTIQSPVEGVIIDRRVNVGQTVVASLNAPSLFLIAKDLTRMQIWVGVNEADVGKITPGTPVTFTCDTFPDRDFNGVVGKVRLNATMTQNVVMYTVEVNIDNSDKLLLPYLTANVHFLTRKDQDALLVPNSALRWSPSSTEEIALDARDSKLAQLEPINTGSASKKAKSGADPSASDSRADRGKKAEKLEPANKRQGVLWLKEDKFVRPIQVKLGISDGNETSVAAEALSEGQEIVVGELTQSSPTAIKNPFLPQVRKRGG